MEPKDDAPKDAPQATRIRHATFDDAEAIRRILRSNGLDDFDPHAWRAVWQSYPFAGEFLHIPIGLGSGKPTADRWSA
jgi:hypothetical protein